MALAQRSLSVSWLRPLIRPSVKLRMWMNSASSLAPLARASPT